MSIDRVGIIEAALAELGIKPWRQTRYANNTGTCLWCDNGSLTMVPDDIELEYFCQATGAEELIVRLKLIADPRIAAAMAAPSVAAPVEVTDLGEGHRALLAAGDALYRAGYNEALEEAREVFVVAIRSRFGDLPPTLEERIRKGSLGEMKEWAERLRHATRPVQ
ncbi:MAG: hypothetical protein KC620_11445, partial [Myxococcales bacterium]|nr:hypothetical protein [Myxococcales bacterium]